MSVTMSIEVTTHSQAETLRIAEAMATLLRGGDVIALNGPLGAGKTSFVRGLARGLRLDETKVSSPTFVISHVYGPAHDDDRDSLTLVHVDAYRLRDLADLDTIGWDELLTQPKAVIAVEWAERIEPALPARRIDVHLEHVGEEARRITIADRGGDDADRFAYIEIFAGGSAGADQCPICGRPVDSAAGGDTFPFCSQRCRMADLGRWFSGSRAISRPIEESDLYEQ